MSLTETVRFILDHPLNAGAKGQAIGRYIAWQLRSRLLPGPAVVPFVNGARLLVRRGRTGGTGNLYTRLHEFAEMGFVLHALRPGELFVDVGANIGAYTILAASLPGTRCISFEPIRAAYEDLVENVRLNDFGSRVTVSRTAIGNEDGVVRMTTGLDTINHVVSAVDLATAQESVPVKRLDTALEEHAPTVMKIDVEGYETPVVEGARKVLQEHSLLAVVIEMNGSGRRYGFDDERLNEVLHGHGFTPLTYDPVTRQLIPVPQMNPTGNRIYVRDRDAMQQRLRAAPRFTVAGGSRI